MLIAVNYHYVRPSFDAPYPGIHGATVAEFERQLLALSRQAQFVGPDQVRAAVQGESRLPSRSVLVTFDDGLREQYDHALPVLQRLGIPALFFVNTGPILDGTVSLVHKLHLCRAMVSPPELVALLRRHTQGHSLERYLAPVTAAAVAQYRYDTPEAAQLKYALNFLLPRGDREALIAACFDEVFAGQESTISRTLYMDVDQLRGLSALGSVGSHGHEHLPLGLLPIREAEATMAASTFWLNAWTGHEPFALSYPYGSRDACSGAVATAAGELGIDFAFTMERAGNPDLTAPRLLARYSASDLPTGSDPAEAMTAFFDQAAVRSWHRRPAAAIAV
jgi:peptidoglycan/xylan/chitin deacetylase (PgdA/CDA1 family)